MCALAIPKSGNLSSSDDMLSSKRMGYSIKEYSNPKISNLSRLNSSPLDCDAITPTTHESHPCSNDTSISDKSFENPSGAPNNTNTSLSNHRCSIWNSILTKQSSSSNPKSKPEIPAPQARPASTEDSLSESSSSDFESPPPTSSAISQRTPSSIRARYAKTQLSPVFSTTSSLVRSPSLAVYLHPYIQPYRWHAAATNIEQEMPQMWEFRLPVQEETVTPDSQLRCCSQTKTPTLSLYDKTEGYPLQRSKSDANLIVQLTDEECLLLGQPFGLVQGGDASVPPDSDVLKVEKDKEREQEEQAPGCVGKTPEEMKKELWKNRMRKYVPIGVMILIDCILFKCTGFDGHVVNEVIKSDEKKKN